MKTTLLMLLMIFPSVMSLLRPGFYPIYDDMQVIRLEQMDKCIKDLQIPCRWVPDLGFGFGYPLYQYYAPLPYYFMEIFHLVGFGFIDSVKIGFIASVILSAIIFYRLARTFASSWPSLLATFIYIYAPFRAMDIYVRGAMGEAWGLAALPAAFLAIKILGEDRKNSVLKSSVLLVFFLLSHNLTIIMSLIPLALFWLYEFYASKHNLKFVISTLKSFLLAAGLSFFYLFPLIVEKNLVQLETLTQGYFNYLAHFLSFDQIFFSLQSGFGPSILGSGDETFLGLGPIHSLLFLVAVMFIFSSKKLAQKLFMAIIGLIFVAGVFLSHQKSVLIWETLPLMSFFQFPWRFILLSVFASSLAVLAIPTKYLKVVALFAIPLIINLYFPLFRPKEWLNITDQEKLSGKNYELGQTASIYDYLPKTAKIAPQEKAPEVPVAEIGQISAISLKKGTDSFSYQIIVDSDTARVMFPMLDFPTWKMKANAIEKNFTTHPEFGYLVADFSRGSHHVELKLTKTTSRSMADAVSAISLLVLLYLVWKKKRF